MKLLTTNNHSHLLELIRTSNRDNLLLYRENIVEDLKTISSVFILESLGEVDLFSVKESIFLLHTPRMSDFAKPCSYYKLAVKEFYSELLQELGFKRVLTKSSEKLASRLKPWQIESHWCKR